MFKEQQRWHIRHAEGSRGRMIGNEVRKLMRSRGEIILVLKVHFSNFGFMSETRSHLKVLSRRMKCLTTVVKGSFYFPSGE